VKSFVLLMIEPEQPEALSARKLVVETAKHNVITAYDAESGLDLLRRFPNVDAVFVHLHLLEKNPELMREIRRLAPGPPLILASPLGLDSRPEADFVVDSHRPDALVQLLSEELQADIRN
jgi:DNA-binding response OmpR family regulator